MNFAKLQPILLFLTTFLAGAASMAIEFTAIRLLAPTFGNSMEIWALNIAVILAGMALGYYMGGDLSKKYQNSQRLVYTIISATGVLVVFSYTGLDPIVNFVTLSPVVIKASLLIKALIVLLVLFFTPVFLLGSIYPLIIENLKNKQSGEASGLVFALSTLGSIFGVLLPSFILIPWIGAKNSLLFIGIILELIAVAGFTKLQKFIPVLIIFGILSLARNEYLIKQPAFDNYHDGKIVYQTESTYQKIKVIEKDWGYMLSLGDNNYFSSMYTKDSFLTGEYYDYYSLLPLIRDFDNQLDVLILGLGGGTISRQYQHFYAQKRLLAIDGVEIDPAVVKAGKMFFELDQPSLTIHETDARVFLNQTSKKYDIIILDSYARQSYIPSHLATQEFLLNIKNHLKNNGIVAFNVSASSAQDFRFKALSNTAKSVFEYTYYFTPQNTANFMILASTTEFDYFYDFPEQKNISEELKPLAERIKQVKPIFIQNVDAAFVLRDDSAPDRL